MHDAAVNQLFVLHNYGVHALANQRRLLACSGVHVVVHNFHNIGIFGKCLLLHVRNAKAGSQGAEIRMLGSAAGSSFCSGWGKGIRDRGGILLEDKFSV